MQVEAVTTNQKLKKKSKNIEREIQETSNNKKKEDWALHDIRIKKTFNELSRTLEVDVCSVIESRMKAWKEENLQNNGATVMPVNLVTTALTRSHTANKRTLKDGVLPSRIFIARPSLLSELLEINHIRSIYNVFAAILFILFINKVMEEIIKTGSLGLELSFISWSFGSFDKVIIIWLYMMVSTSVLVYLCFHYWAHHRHIAPGVYDAIGTLLYIIYLTLFLQFPVRSLIRNKLPPASSIVVLCEQVRLFMKTWAFVRTNIGCTLKYKKGDSHNSETICPNFSQYLYFLFVPTLVYRNEYPRNESCNWTKVVKEFAQVLGCVLYTHFLFARFCIPVFEKFGREEFSNTKLMMAVFTSCFPGSLMLLCGFFAILHAWMNAFAEMMKFADRMFYKDWWNSTSYPRFYRTWNCIVHDWLYEYVYKELYELQTRMGGICLRVKYIPMFVVFFISAAVHEYILAIAFRFYYPVLLVLFGGFGVLFMFIDTKAQFFNAFMWVSLILGTGILMCLYSMEWYARINCPPVMDGLYDYVIPRSWFCYS